jgi:RNA polymerase sigma factor (sigma-70 family)
VTEQESAEIVRRAKRLSGCSVAEVCRRIGRRLNRSPQTILYVGRKHSGNAIFADAPAEMSADERDRVLQWHRRGIGLSAIARRIQRPRGEIYRVLLDERVARLNRKKIKFIDDPLYHGEGAEKAVDAIANQEPIGKTSTSPEETRMPRDVPPYLQELYRTPLLTPTRERALFLKFNFHKYQFVTARRKLDPQYAKSRDLARLERLLRKAIDTKNAIVQANLRLVVSIARKHLRPALSLMELVSEGNVTLMRAVEGFDIHRGHRFSTYATLALMKGFARSVPAMVGASRSESRRLAEVPDSRLARLGERIVHRDEIRQLLSRLDERERTVLLAHYGLCEEHVAETYEQVGERLGLSKQRVRQIEQGALAKLRTNR